MREKSVQEIYREQGKFSRNNRKHEVSINNHATLRFLKWSWNLSQRLPQFARKLRPSKWPCWIATSTKSCTFLFLNILCKLFLTLITLKKKKEHSFPWRFFLSLETISVFTATFPLPATLIHTFSIINYRNLIKYPTIWNPTTINEIISCPFYRYSVSHSYHFYSN